MTLDELHRHDEEVASALSKSMGPQYQKYKRAGVETIDMLAMVIGRTVIVTADPDDPQFTIDEAEPAIERYRLLACAERAAIFARKQ